MSVTYRRTVSAGPAFAEGAGSAQVVPRPKRRPRYRLRRYGMEALAIVFGLLIAVWSILPIYNMVIISIDSHDDVFSGAIWPEHPSLESFRVVVTEDFWHLP